MKELVSILFPAKEWGEAEALYESGDLRVVVLPLVVIAAAVVGFIIGG